MNIYSNADAQQSITALNKAVGVAGIVAWNDGLHPQEGKKTVIAKFKEAANVL